MPRALRKTPRERRSPVVGGHEQVATIPITLRDILASTEFAQGLSEVRRGSRSIRTTAIGATSAVGASA